MLFSISNYAQLISGQLLNETTKEPIFGVTISSNGMPYAFSDQEGKFEIEDSSTIKELTFSHLAFFEKKINAVEFINKGQVVYLSEKAIVLNEVQIGRDANDITLDDIIKRSSLKYNKSFNSIPYFARINTKQIVMQKNKFLGYLEIDGILCNFIPEDLNPFKFPFILPKEIRKSSEDTELTDYASKNKLPYNTICTELLRGSFIDIQSSNVSHPLLRKHKYRFEKLEDVEIDGELFYQIQFFQKKGINVKRDLFNVYGEMLISKKDFTIVKHKVSFDFDNIHSNEIEISYTKKGDQIIQSKIELSSKIINSKYKKKEISNHVISTIDTSFSIDATEISKRLGFHLCYYVDELKYHPNYWQQKSRASSTNLIDNYLNTLTPQDFEDGSKQKLLDKTSKFYSKDHENIRIQQITRHQETLKNIKL